MCIRTKPPVVIYTRTCVAKSLGANATCAGVRCHGQIPNRRPISERPSHIEDLKKVGYWEGDTVIGTAHKQAIVTLVEHKSGFAVMAKVLNKSADLVGRAIEAKLKPLNPRVKTLTVDNGKEFTDHQAIEQALGI